MRNRTLADKAVSEIGTGCWQIGGTEWGDIAAEDALAALQTAHDHGVTIFDTADIYGAGRSELLVGQLLATLRTRGGALPFVATKLGRSADPGWPENFELATMRRHAEGSLERLGVDCLDLLQLHCVPPEVLARGAIFDHLRALRDEGLIAAFGASVESIEEAELCLAHDDLASLQIIFNILRQAPAAALFERAAARGVGILVRLPLASGMLAGRFTPATTFAPTDHRTFNRDGEAFHVGETFAGIPFERGLELVEEIRPHVPPGMTMAQFSQRWILDHPAVTTVITGVSKVDQARENAAVSDLPPLDAATHAALADLYVTRIRDAIRGPI